MCLKMAINISAANAPTSSATPPVESREDSFSNGTPEPAITPSASEIPSGMF